jgi:ribose/xylose/arabinose/galactoside ABC-type transport system permease subunit
VHAGGAPRGSLVGAIARQRELTLVAVMLVMGVLVSLAAPQFLTADNLRQVATLASITAIAAIGQALVVITRNIDLSVEATMGLVAYCVAITLESHLLNGPSAMLLGIGIGAVLGMVNGLLVSVFRVPSSLRPVNPATRRSCRAGMASTSPLSSVSTSALRFWSTTTSI